MKFKKGINVNIFSLRFYNHANAASLVPNFFTGTNQEIEVRHRRELVSLLKSFENKRFVCLKRYGFIPKLTK